MMGACVLVSVCGVVSMISMVDIKMDSHQTLSEVHLGTKTNCSGFGVKRSKVKVTKYAKKYIFGICFHDISGMH